jgi:hypothetical protein
MDCDGDDSSWVLVDDPGRDHGAARRSRLLEFDVDGGAVCTATEFHATFARECAPVACAANKCTQAARRARRRRRDARRYR